MVNFLMISRKEIQTATEKRFSRSSGPGGQHANKASTKIQLTFHIRASSLTEDEKERLLKKFPSGEINVSNEETRYQRQNVGFAFERLQALIEKNLQVAVKRKRIKAPHLTRSGKLQHVRKKKWLRFKKRNIDQLLD